MGRDRKYYTNLPPIYPNTTNNLEFRVETGSDRAPVARVQKRDLTSKYYKDMVYPQAHNIVAKFGTPYVLCNVVNQLLPEGQPKWAPSTVYRWMYPKGVNFGTGGEIPVRKIKMILKAARYFGVIITMQDLYPKLIDEWGWSTYSARL